MFTGTVIAQGIPLVAAPILTRIYPPASYGQYALFMLVSYTLSALASLRYEMAILNAKDDEEVLSVLALALGAPVVVGIALASTVLCLQHFRATADAWYDGKHAHMLAPMVVLQSAFQALNYLQLRKRQFRALSIARVARAVVVASTNVSFGLLGFLSTGLIWGAFAGQLMSTGILAAIVLRQGELPFGAFRIESTFAAARRHRDFALFALPADLLSTVSAQLPLVFFSDGTRGLFSFTMTILGAPLTFVAGAIHDAFKERASRDFRENGSFAEIFTRLTRVLVLLSVAPALVLLVGGPTLFGFAFGEQWRTAGDFARILSLMFAIKLIVSPLSYSYFIVGKQREDFLLHLYIAASTALILWWGSRTGQSDQSTLIFYSINYFIFYVVFFVRSWTFSKGKPGVTEPLKPHDG